MHSTPSPTDSSNCFCSSSAVGLTDCPHATVQCWSDWTVLLLVWLDSSTVGLTGQFHCWSSWLGVKHQLTYSTVGLTDCPCATVALLVWLNSCTVGLTDWQGAIKPVVTLECFLHPGLQIVAHETWLLNSMGNFRSVSDFRFCFDHFYLLKKCVSKGLVPLNSAKNVAVSSFKLQGMFQLPHGMLKLPQGKQGLFRLPKEMFNLLQRVYQRECLNYHRDYLNYHKKCCNYHRDCSKCHREHLSYHMESITRTVQTATGK